jgi:hypothetical protein
MIFTGALLGAGCCARHGERSEAIHVADRRRADLAEAG